MTTGADERDERLVGGVLRAGVTLAAAMVTAGTLLYLARHGATPANYRTFHGVPSGTWHIPSILAGVAALDGASMIAFGLLVLIATPIVRVALLVLVFLRERDRLYVAISAVVLIVLLLAVARA